MICQKRMEPCMKEGRSQKHKQLLSLPAACVGAAKAGVVLQESLQSPAHTWGQLPFPAGEHWRLCRASLWLYSGSTAGLGPRGILHLWMCRVELCLGSWQSRAMFRQQPRAAGGQESAAVGHRGLTAFLTSTGPAASFHWNSCELPAPLTNIRPQISYHSQFL